MSAQNLTPSKKKKETKKEISEYIFKDIKDSSSTYYKFDDKGNPIIPEVKSKKKKTKSVAKKTEQKQTSEYIFKERKDTDAVYKLDKEGKPVIPKVKAKKKKTNLVAPKNRQIPKTDAKTENTRTAIKEKRE